MFYFVLIIINTNFLLNYYSNYVVWYAYGKVVSLIVINSVCLQMLIMLYSETEKAIIHIMLDVAFSNIGNVQVQGTFIVCSSFKTYLFKNVIYFMRVWVYGSRWGRITRIVIP